MYNLPHFKEPDEKVIREFIDANPFAFIAGADANQMPVATQLPVFLEQENGKQYLRGHIMKNADHHKAFIENPNVLVVFTGKHTYVSATWYSNPHQASTWNYMSVHARGQIKFLGADALVSILRKTTLHFENQDASSTTVFDNLPADYTERLMKGIVAFEIEVQDLQHVFKLSQNHNRETYSSIIDHLKEQGADAATIAEEMGKRQSGLFPG